MNIEAISEMSEQDHYRGEDAKRYFSRNEIERFESFGFLPHVIEKMKKRFNIERLLRYDTLNSSYEVDGNRKFAQYKSLISMFVAHPDIGIVDYRIEYSYSYDHDDQKVYEGARVYKGVGTVFFDDDGIKGDTLIDSKVDIE